MPIQLVPPIRKVLSTWAICSTRPWLGHRDQAGLGPAPPGEADEHLAGQEPAVVVPPDQAVALEREQQPGGGRLGQPGGRAQPGERHRVG
jgi:hypothetical protein